MEVPLRPAGGRFCTDRAAKELHPCKTGNKEGAKALGSALEAGRQSILHRSRCERPVSVQSRCNRRSKGTEKCP